MRHGKPGRTAWLNPPATARGSSVRGCVDERVLRPDGQPVPPHLPRLGREHRAAGRTAGRHHPRALGGGAKALLDVSCGIGTQALGLARRGFSVTASDLSVGAISRARAEAQRQALPIDLSVCDLWAVHDHHRRQFDVVISAGNSTTHLMSDDDLLRALRQLYACTRPGGGCLLTVRDYDREERG